MRHNNLTPAAVEEGNIFIVQSKRLSSGGDPAHNKHSSKKLYRLRRSIEEIQFNPQANVLYRNKSVMQFFVYWRWPWSARYVDRSRDEWMAWPGLAPPGRNGSSGSKAMSSVNEYVIIQNEIERNLNAIDSNC